MRRIIVKIDRNKAVELERVNFELSFTKDVIQRLIESHPNDTELINGEVFQKYTYVRFCKRHYGNSFKEAGLQYEFS